MPIVFNFDILDLFTRTIVDIIFVFIGAYIANTKIIRNKNTSIYTNTML